MPTYIDLFAGCGGFSVGLRSAGWTSLAEVEIDAWACDSLRANFPQSRVIESDIRGISDDEILQLGPVDLIVGGPPCQGFSVAGSTQFGISDPRNELFRWFLHWIELLRPRAAVIENVPNILSRQAGGAKIVSSIEATLSPLGYTVSAQILNSASYGVPQARRRAFIVMLRNENPFEFPVPTRAMTSAEYDLFTHLKPFTTVGEALSDLPPIAAGEGVDTPVPYASGAANDYQRWCRGDQNKVSNHIAMKHTARLVERFKMIAPGKSLKDVPLSHGQIANGTGEIVTKPFKYNNYRLDPDKPSLAIPASFQSLFLHPFLDRNLTAREAARLMGFPDNFVFKGKRTTMSWEKNLSQYNQIGNAVCPPVATEIGSSLLQQIDFSAPLVKSTHHFDASPNRKKLDRQYSVPQFYRHLPDDLIYQLNNESSCLGQMEESFRFKGSEIPSSSLLLALILAEAKACPVCSPVYAPNARHDGVMCFLISKDDNASLVENEQDHGLDYHLRVVAGIKNQVGHFVGERLSELGFVELTSLQNPRTGRRVRGMRVLKKSVITEATSRRVLDAIQDCTEQYP